MNRKSIPLNTRSHSRKMSLMTILVGISCIFITQVLKNQGFSTMGSIITVVIVYLLFLVLIKRSTFFLQILEREEKDKLSFYRSFFSLRISEKIIKLKSVDRVVIKKYGLRELNIYLIMDDKSSILLNTFRHKELALSFEQDVKNLIRK